MTDVVARVLQVALTRQPQDLTFSDNSYYSEQFIRESIKADFAGWYEPNLVSKQVNFILQECSLPKGARVLDMACGHGRHSVALHAAGFDVVATDISDTLVEHLRTAFPGVTFEKHSFADIDYSQRFDLIAVLGNSMGLIPENQLLEVLPKLLRALSPKGTLVFELDSREGYLKGDLEPRVWALHSGRWLTLSQRHYDPDRKFEKLIDTGLDLETFSVDQFCSTKRLYTYLEINNHLNRAGLRVIRSYGNWSGAKLDERSQSMVLFAEAAS